MCAKILSAAAGLGAEVVVVTGGEPLLRRDLEQIVAHARDLTLDVLLYTTGMSLTRRRASRLASLGVRLVVSLDGATSQTMDAIRGVPGAFRKACGAIRHFEEDQRMDPKGTTTFTVVQEANYRELALISAVALQMGVRQARFALIHGHPWAAFSEQTIAELAEQIALLPLASGAASVSPQLLAASRGELALHHVQQGLPNASLVLAGCTRCPSIDNSLYVGHDGNVYTCAFSAYSNRALDASSSRSPWVIGNVHSEPLEQIWTGARMQRQRKRLERLAADLLAVCGQCESCPSASTDVQTQASYLSYPGLFA